MRPQPSALLHYSANHVLRCQDSTAGKAGIQLRTHGDVSAVKNDC
jgi:hypothetical protein